MKRNDIAVMDIMPCAAKPCSGILPHYNTQTQVLDYYFAH